MVNCRCFYFLKSYKEYTYVLVGKKNYIQTGFDGKPLMPTCYPLQRPFFLSLFPFHLHAMHPPTCIGCFFLFTKESRSAEVLFLAFHLLPRAAFPH